MRNTTSPVSVPNYVRPILVPDVGASFPSIANPSAVQAIKVVLHHEGGWAADPDDPGGATNYGWSLRTAKALGDLDGDGDLDFDLDHDGDVDAADLKKMTIQQAAEFYLRVFWRPEYERLPQCIAIKTMDLAVNMGASQAHKLLQRAAYAVGDVRLVDDGVIGRNTLTAIQQCDPEALLAALRCTAAGFYTELTIKRPRSRKYLGGWLNRAYF